MLSSLISNARVTVGDVINRVKYCYFSEFEIE